LAETFSPTIRALHRIKSNSTANKIAEIDKILSDDPREAE